MPSNVSIERIKLINSLGGRVYLVDSSDFNILNNISIKLSKRLKGYFIDQFNNEQSVLAGYYLGKELSDEIDNIDFSKQIFLFSQTTKSLEGFKILVEKIKERMNEGVNFVYYDTICRQVANREGHLREFAGRFDVIVFVCGAKSSNGKVLYEVCREANQRSYKIEAADELKSEWFKDCESVGICGATSTPKWLMREMADRIASLG